MARPTLYTPQLAARICELVAASDYGLEQICKANDLPAPGTIYRWLSERTEFHEQYARARETQGHVQADRALRDAVEATDAQLGRLRMDARKWAASKLTPKVYGDSAKLELSGHLNLSAMTDEDILDELTRLQASGVPVPLLEAQAEPDDGSDLV